MTQTLVSTPILTATEGLSAYLRMVEAIPVLSAEEEHALAVRFREQADRKAAEQLVLSHLRYVAYIARSYQGYGLAVADLIQEGSIGLMKAVRRFNPSQGVRLVTYSMLWIKSEIQDFVLRNWKIVRMATTKAQRKLFFNLRGRKEKLSWLNDSECAQISHDLKVPLSEVRLMEQRLYSQDISLALPETEEEDIYAPVVRSLVAPVNEEPLSCLEVQDKEKKSLLLQQKLSLLNPRLRRIIDTRWLDESGAITLKDLAEEFGVSIERVRQLEQQALKILKETLVD